MLESGIPARCDICRQFWSYLQKKLSYLPTNHVYLQTILSSDQNYMKKWILAGVLKSRIPGFLHACYPLCSPPQEGGQYPGVLLFKEDRFRPVHINNNNNTNSSAVATSTTTIITGMCFKIKLINQRKLKQNIMCINQYL